MDKLVDVVRNQPSSNLSFTIQLTENASEPFLGVVNEDVSVFADLITLAFRRVALNLAADSALPGGLLLLSNYVFLDR